MQLEAKEEARWEAKGAEGETAHGMEGDLTRDVPRAVAEASCSFTRCPLH